MEWLVNPSWTLQLTRDETDEYRLDARFRRCRYEAHWRFGNSDGEDYATSATMKTGEGATGAEAATFQRSRHDRQSGTRPATHRIGQINFRADAAFDTSAVAQEVTLKPGQTVTIRELQSSIKNPCHVNPATFASMP